MQQCTNTGSCQPIAHWLEITCTPTSSSQAPCATSPYHCVQSTEVHAMEILTSTVILSMLISLGIFIRLVIKTLNEHD